MQQYNEMTDEGLVELFHGGDEEAFNEIYRRYSSRLVKVIYYYVGDMDSAEDVLHETFMRMIRHLHTFKKGRAFSSWIFQIAVNCSKNHLKKSRRKDELFEKMVFRSKEGKFESPSPEEELMSNFEVESFNSAVEKIHPRFREVLLLRIEGDCRYADISRILGCSERTAKWRMKKAVELIVHELKELKCLQ